MVRPRAPKKVKLSKESVTDVEWLSKYEKYYSLITFKYRVLHMAGYKHLREDMKNASEQEWERIYNEMYLNK